MQLSRLIRPDLATLEPYQPEKAPHRIKLDANENPYDLPRAIKEEIADLLLTLPVHRYPDPTAARLRKALARHHGVDPGQVLVGNGSDEIIGYLLTLFARDEMEVVVPTPTFSMYQILARVAGVEAHEVPLTDDFQLDPEALLTPPGPGRRRIYFFSYPNNPTGNCWDRGVLLQCLQQEDTLVVMDEAYAEFSGQSFLPLLESYPNLLILRTFSKAYGLAGLRVGVLIASEEIVQAVHRVRLPYNVNALSQAVALIALQHQEIFREQIATILRERKRLQAALERTAGLEPFPTDANFILFRAHQGADRVFEHLLSRGILVRNLHRPGLLENCLRITVGTEAENQRVIQALEALA